MGCWQPGFAGGMAGRRGLSWATKVLVLNVNPASHGTPSSIHALNRAISFADSGSPLDGMRISLSVDVMRLNRSLALLLPGTTIFDFIKSSRVSIDTAPLYLPFVWHSPQRALMIGAMSCAKSIFFSWLAI